MMQSVSTQHGLAEEEKDFYTAEQEVGVYSMCIFKLVAWHACNKTSTDLPIYSHVHVCVTKSLMYVCICPCNYVYVGM